MKRRSSIIFLRYFFQFLLVILVFVVAISVIFRKIEDRLQQNTFESNKAILEQAASVSDYYLDSMHTMISQLMLDPSLSRLVYPNPNSGSRGSYYMLEARNSLRSVEMLNDFASLIYIYYSNPQIVLTASTAYTDPKLFYSVHLQGNSFSYEEWLEDMNGNHMQDFYPSQVSYIDGIRENVIAYEQSIPLTSGISYNRGTLGVLIREKTVRQMMQNLNVEDGWYYIMDGNSGKMIASSCALSEAQLELDADNDVFDGQKMVFAKTNSRNGWIFAAALPYDVVMQDVRVVYRSIVLSCVISTLLSIIFSIYAAYSNSTPVIHLLSNLKSDDDENRGKISEIYFDHFAFIESMIGEINDHNRYLTQQQSNNLPLLRAYFFERLMNGQLERTEELYRLMQQLGIPVGATGYCCVYMLLDSEDDDSKKVISGDEDTLLLIQKIGRQFNNDLLVFPYLINRRSCLMLMCADKCRNEEHLRTLICDFCEVMLQQSRKELFFACGSCVGSPLALHQTIEEAGRVMMSTAYRRSFSGVLWYNEAPLSEDIYRYSQEDASHLSSLLRSGNYEECRAYLRDLLRENMEDRALSPKMISHLLHEISGTIIDAALPMGEAGQKIALALVENQPSGERYSVEQYICQMYESMEVICENISLVHNERRKRQVEKLVEYIQENYSDSNLSLFSIAGEFGMSKSYLSSFFREYTGVNISRYIENVRINAACELLQKGEMNIDQIAGTCGYNSALSFRRAFKRLKGINPSEMKSANKLEGE